MQVLGGARQRTAYDSSSHVNYIERFRRIWPSGCEDFRRRFGAQPTTQREAPGTGTTSTKLKCPVLGGKLSINF